MKSLPGAAIFLPKRLGDLRYHPTEVSRYRTELQHSSPLSVCLAKTPRKSSRLLSERRFFSRFSRFAAATGLGKIRDDVSDASIVVGHRLDVRKYGVDEVGDFQLW